MAKRKRGGGPSRYEEIAADIANRVVNHEYQEGERIFGRSSLAGVYRVSPETIRRAIALLHSHGVVRAVAGTGIIILSEQAAAKYLEEFQLGSALGKLQAELADLLAERRRLDQAIEEALERAIHYTAGTLATMRHVEELPVPAGSPLVGETLASVDLRVRTGATVIAVVRGAEELYSPGPGLRLSAGDLLMLVGSQEAREKARALVEGREAPVAVEEGSEG